jgi:hypothetical protein
VKVLVICALPAFGSDPERDLSDELAIRLRHRGHVVEIVRLPLWGTDPDRIALDMLVARSLEISNTDHVIALGFPGMLVRHPSKTLWMLEPPPTGSPLIAAAVAESIAESRAALAASWETADAFRMGSGVRVVVPRSDPGRPAPSSPGLIAYPARFARVAGHDLLLRALARTSSHVRLALIGDDDGERASIEALADDLGIDSRIEFASGPSAGALLDRVSTVIHHDQPVTQIVDSARAGKAVIAVGASAAAESIVGDQLGGWHVRPYPDDLAAAMSAAVFSPTETRRRGRAARRAVLAAERPWAAVLDEVLP